MYAHDFFDSVSCAAFSKSSMLKISSRAGFSLEVAVIDRSVESLAAFHSSVIVDVSNDPIWPCAPSVSLINEGECTRPYSSVASFPANLCITIPHKRLLIILYIQNEKRTLRSSRMLRCEFSHVVHLSVDNNPDIIQLIMLQDHLRCDFSRHDGFSLVTVMEGSMLYAKWSFNSETLESVCR